jgi:hypothetical protein
MVLLLPGDPGFNAILQSRLSASDIPNCNYIANESGILEAVDSKQFLEYAYDSYAGWDTDDDNDNTSDNEEPSLLEADRYLWELQQDFKGFLSTGKT